MKTNSAMETSFRNNFINQRWRLGTFTTLLGFFILLSFLTFLYQTPNLSPLEIIKSTPTRTTSTATPPTPLPLPPTPLPLPAPPPPPTPTPTPTPTPLVVAPGTTITSLEELTNTSKNTTVPSFHDETYEESSTKESIKTCDIFNGKWVYDPKGSPLYKNHQCPFLSEQVSCQNNGRPENEYEKWRWEAKDCQIPRWSGKEMLEKLRGKRVIVVGDSINRNQWESFACLLYSSVSPRRAFVDSRNGLHMIFKAKDYNCTVEFFWSPFLVELDKNNRVLKIDKLSPTANQWRGADIMVFNTGHWWTHMGKSQVWDSLEQKGKLVKDMDLETAFEIAMKTWATWIDLNIDPTKTTVFFRTISATHKGNQRCFNETQPFKDDSYVTLFPRSIVETVVKTVTEMRTPTKLLNITKLSEYRKDAHPSIYTSKTVKLLTMEEKQNPELHGDCNHWCLPGVPDTWNSLLLTSVFFDSFPGPVGAQFLI